MIKDVKSTVDGSKSVAFSPDINGWDKVKIFAVCEPDIQKHEKLKTKYNIDDNMCFSSLEDLLKHTNNHGSYLICALDTSEFEKNEPNKSHIKSQSDTLVNHKHNMGKSSKEKFSDVRNIIFKNASDNWTLKKMADISGYSTSRFSYHYKRIFGISPMTDLMNMRIENSKNLLLKTDLSIGNISFQSGFSTDQNFSYSFKKTTGLSPKEYRIKYK